ncbi:MAG: hypothetical protein COA99_17730 [Moraxellaceae bacterium]|nr:MAG: hypothetical protein COA99_17730 [Moraxellaceae bacterium]
MHAKLLISLLVTLFSLSASPTIFADTHRGLSDDHISDTGSEHRSDGKHYGYGQTPDKDIKDNAKDQKVKKDKKEKKAKKN